MKEETKCWAVIIILWTLCIFVGGLFSKFILQLQTPQDNFLFGSGVSAISLFILIGYVTSILKNKNPGVME